MILISIICGLLTITIVNIIFAWTNPTANPPSGGGALYYYNGNVGIGTTTPQTKFHLAGFTGAGFRITPSTGLADEPFSVRGTDGVTHWLTVASNGNVVMSGNVGIGTTTPSTPLHIRYVGASDNPIGFQDLGLLVSSNDDDAVMQFNAGFTPQNYYIGIKNDKFGIGRTTLGSDLTIDGTGNVGIGTTAPATKTEIRADDVTTNAVTNVLKLVHGTTGTAADGIGTGIMFAAEGLSDPYPTGYIESRLVSVASGNSEMGFKVLSGGNTYEWLTIKRTGNVGIGTTAPGYKLQVGTSGDGTSAIANAWNVFSDIRLKTNITPLTDILPKLNNINVVGFNWKDGADKKRQIGFIAQEVEKVFPELVFEDDKGYKSVDYSKFSAILLGAVKEQQKQIEELKSEIKTLKENK